MSDPTDDEVFAEMMEEIKRLAEEVNDASHLKKAINKLWEDKTFQTKMATINMIFYDLIMEESDDAMEAAAYVARMASTTMKLIDAAVLSSDDDDDEEELLQ